MLFRSFARAGDPVVLSSIAQGGTVTNYAWRQGVSSNVLGTSDELVIPVATNAHIGTYTLWVQGPGGSNTASSRLVFDAPFAAWRSSYPEHWSASTTPAVDPLGGSNILLFRYAVGMTPSQELKRRPRGGFAKIGGSSYLTLTFPQRYRPAADLVMTIEASTNLVTWQAIAAPEVSSQPLDGAFRQVTVRDVLPVGTGQRFLRLRVALVSL